MEEQCQQAERTLSSVLGWVVATMRCISTAGLSGWFEASCFCVSTTGTSSVAGVSVPQPFGLKEREKVFCTSSGHFTRLLTTKWLDSDIY